MKVEDIAAIRGFHEGVHHLGTVGVLKRRNSTFGSWVPPKKLKVYVDRFAARVAHPFSVSRPYCWGGRHIHAERRVFNTCRHARMSHFSRDSEGWNQV